jgi:2-polyprenyl-3-methyl-5-hydroxy-6-metoxy-1,4-benzoquinol methylase
VRDNSDPAIGAGVIGQAVAGLGREVVQFDRREKAIEAARQKASDGNLSANVVLMQQKRDAEYETFKGRNDQGKWQEFRLR